MPEPVVKKSRTPRLDAALQERFERDPRAFALRTYLNLFVGIFFLAIAGGLAYFGIKVVGLAYGGDALLLMVLTIVLIAIAVLHDVNWRLSLQRSGRSASLAPPAAGGKGA